MESDLLVKLNDHVARLDQLDDRTRSLCASVMETTRMIDLVRDEFREAKANAIDEDRPELNEFVDSVLQLCRAFELKLTRGR